MPLANCPRCKKLFSRVRTPVCPACEAEEDADLDKVRRSLEERPNQTTEEVAESTGVDRECVLRFIEAGHIANVTLAEPVKCGRCGAPAISVSKRLCEACLSELSMELAAEQSKIKLPPKKGISVADVGKSVKQIVEEKRKPV